MKAESIQLKQGERIDVVKREVGYSIIGPAIVVVLKEESAAATTDSPNDSKEFVWDQDSWE